MLNADKAWPPATVQTPMGEEPFKQAVQWHLPTILRDIAMTADIGYDASGSLASHTLRAAADSIESLARRPDPAPKSAAPASGDVERIEQAARQFTCRVYDHLGKGRTGERTLWQHVYPQFKEELREIALAVATEIAATQPPADHSRGGEEPFTSDNFAVLWDAFSDADKHLLPDDFEEQAEAAGLIECVPVTPDALEDAFAAERGIEPGGMMWQLTAKGKARWSRDEGTPTAPLPESAGKFDCGNLGWCHAPGHCTRHDEDPETPPKSAPGDVAGLIERLHSVATEAAEYAPLLDVAVTCTEAADALAALTRTEQAESGEDGR